MQKDKLRKIIAISVITILIINLLLLSFRLITPLVFWIVVISGAIAAFGMKKIE